MMMLTGVALCAGVFLSTDCCGVCVLHGSVRPWVLHALAQGSRCQLCAASPGPRASRVGAGCQSYATSRNHYTHAIPLPYRALYPCAHRSLSPGTRRRLSCFTLLLLLHRLRLLLAARSRLRQQNQACPPAQVRQHLVLARQGVELVHHLTLLVLDCRNLRLAARAVVRRPVWVGGCRPVLI